MPIHNNFLDLEPLLLGQPLLMPPSLVRLQDVILQWIGDVDRAELLVAHAMPLRRPHLDSLLKYSIIQLHRAILLIPSGVLRRILP